jgi:mono/diheme cytochrome c family protein
MKIRAALLITAAAVLVVLGAAATRSADEAWVGFQKKYLELSAARSKGPVEPQPIELKQDRLQGFQGPGDERIDRCRSCHVAVDDPRFAGDAQPLRTHPSIAPHAFGELGCTICHEGEGRATTAFLAHGKDHFWPEPLLTGKFVEASCARCHPAPYLAETPHLRRGRELFEKNACVGCHRVQGLSRGNLGVELTDVGAKRTVDFIQKKLRNPLFNVPATIMPKLRLSDEDVSDLAVFLKSLKGRPVAEDPMSFRKRVKAWTLEAPPEVEATAEVGRRLVESRGCTACHKLGAGDGGLAPDLSFLGQVRDARYVEGHLADPRARTPGSNMPNFWLSASERAAIAAYLTSLGGYVRPATPKDQYAQLCARCHGEKGDGEGVAAANLLPRPRVFTNAKFFNWLPEERAYKAIREGVPGTAMPPFGKILDEADAKALFAFVRKTFIGAERTQPAVARQVPEKNPVAYSAESVQRGKDVFAERCYGCHGRLGDGKGPNAPEMLPRPRNLANHAFFAGLPDARLFETITYGIVGTGMPPWDSLPESERWDLVNFVRHLSSTGPAAQQREKR